MALLNFLHNFTFGSVHRDIIYLTNFNIVEIYYDISLIFVSKHLDFLLFFYHFQYYYSE